MQRFFLLGLLCLSFVQSSYGWALRFVNNGTGTLTWVNVNWNNGLFLGGFGGNVGQGGWIDAGSGGDSSASQTWWGSYYWKSNGVECSASWGPVTRDGMASPAAIINLDTTGGPVIPSYTGQLQWTNTSPYKQWYQLVSPTGTNWISALPYERVTLDVSATNSGYAQVYNVDCFGCYGTGQPMISKQLQLQAAQTGTNYWTGTVSQPSNLVDSWTGGNAPSTTNSGPTATYQSGNALLNQGAANQGQTHEDLKGIKDELSIIRFMQTNSTASDAKTQAITNSVAQQNHNGTNWSGPQATVEGILDSSGVSAQISELENRLAIPTLPPASRPGVFDMDFCGQRINLDPIQRYPQIVQASFLMFKIVFILSFVVAMAHLYWKVLQIYASQSSGGVPELGVGGGAATVSWWHNLSGIATAILVPVVFVTGWVVVLHLVLGKILDNWQESLGIMAFADSLSGVAWYFLASLIPVQLGLTLFLTYLVCHFTLGKVLMIASGVSRFLWGK